MSMLHYKDPVGGDATSSNQVLCSIDEADGGAYEFSLIAPDTSEFDTDCVVVGIADDGRFSTMTANVDDATSGRLSDLIGHGLLPAKLGATLLVPMDGPGDVRASLLVGTGPDCTVEPGQFRKIVEAVHEELVKYGIGDATLYLTGIDVRSKSDHWKVQQQVIGFGVAAYRFRGVHSESGRSTLRRVSIAASGALEPALREGRAIAGGVCTARRLGDASPNVCTPGFLAGVARSLADRFERVSAEVLDEEEMSGHGMNALLSVGQGSAQPSKFVVLEYRPEDGAGDAPVVLVGKGVTFDTGGTALKTRTAMARMKYDMCGAAAVIATIRAVAELQLPMPVVGLCACAENMPGSRATRPSDTVTSMSGQSIEILNPDAEGRLLLCDALTYAERYRPAAVVDIATLTGASLVALGRHYSAMFANDDALARDLLDAGDESLDKLWRLPLSEEDISQLDSDYADMANMGDGTAGCIVAALFLSRFAGSLRWAHLDVSGTAKTHGEKPAATGRPVAMLMQYLLQRSRATTGGPP